MAVLARENLRGDIVGRPAKSLPLLSFKFDPLSQSKITNLTLELIIEENVAQFQIPVNIVVIMDVCEALSNMLRVIENLQFSESLSCLEQHVKGTIRAKLQNHKHIKRVLEEVLKLCDVLMLHSFVYLNLRMQLLFGSISHDGVFINNLDSIVSPILQICDLVAVGESSFSEEPAFLILSDNLLTIFRILNLLNYNDFALRRSRFLLRISLAALSR